MDKEMLSQVRQWADKIEIPRDDACGPAMKALNENQRRYVCALGVFGNHQTLAYQWAYGIEKETTARTNSARLGAQEKIKAAIQEHYSEKINVLGPALASERLLELLGPTTTDPKLVLKAIQIAADIIPGFKAATEHKITVTHQMSLADLEARRAQLEQELGIKQLVHQALDGQVVDAEYSEVVEDDDLSDIM